MERAIAVLTDVKDLGELLQGASLEEVHVEPVGGRLQLALELTRAVIERQTVVRAGWFRRAKTPWTKSQLTLKGINALTIRRLTETSPNHVPLLACDAVQGGYQLTVRALDGLQFVLGLSQLEGSFRDVGNLIESS